MKKLFLILLLNAFFGSIWAQTTPEHRFGELIFKIDNGAAVTETIAKINRTAAVPPNLALKRALAPEWNIYLLSFDENACPPEALLNACYKVAGIEWAELNRKVEDRSITPNDPDWYQQSDMTLINAPEAWMTSTGGLTLKGDTIVVAVLEKGILFSHPDLVPNRYWNWQETPHDGVDNDGNGFIDDRGGWNPETQNDGTGTNGDHGTAVAGIIGASGNNNVGISGVNWNVKLLNLSGIEYTSDIIEGYQYVYKMRKLYNETNGAKGAFVVATNASFGYDTVFPNANPDYLTWCSLYDSLGTVGVLNMGATSNLNVNVDEVGDMPTACPSEYLIAVTNVNKLGSWVQSGYGKTSVDLGAPGIGTYSTVSINGTTPGYGTIGGTSAATPHVTGAVALLYSLGCEAFTSDARTDPSACARRVRDAILNNTNPNPDLTSSTTTGGNLDLERAVNGVTELCQGVVGPLDILKVRTITSTNLVRVYYQTPTFLPYKFRVFNALGQLMYEKVLTPLQFSENVVDFDTFDLPKGVYVISISRGNAIVSVKFPKI